MVKVIVIAGTHSGVGKTSLSVGLMLALRQKGLKVQPFKVGPDFLDPLHHVAACGRESINLDGWMLNKQQVLDSFHRHTADADVAIVEGVMGLYDSRDGSSDDGSTAQIAKWLGAPVVLVVDCWSMARSAAALVKGYAEFDPDLQLCGVLLNKVGSTGHGVWLAEALAAAWQQQRLQQQVKVLGCIPKDDSVTVPERYLGLTMPHEQDNSAAAAADNVQQGQGNSAGDSTSQQQSVTQEAMCTEIPTYLTRLAQHVSKHIDLDVLLEVAATVTLPATEAPKEQCACLSRPDQGLGQWAGQAGAAAALVLSPQPQPAYRCRIAVARDEAFCFYYQDNFALLRSAGADLVSFSPLRSPHLPDGIFGIYFGGGYPERYAQQLSNNTSLLSEVRHWAASGGVVYAECGGLIYLCQGFEPPLHKPAGAIETATNSSSSSSSSKVSAAAGTTAAETSSTSSSSRSRDTLIPLVGLLPFKACMGGMKMGYVEVQVLPGNPLFPAGAHVRGQVYHFSQVEPCSTQESCSSSHETGPQSNCAGRSPGHSNSSSCSRNTSASTSRADCVCADLGAQSKPGDGRTSSRSNNMECTVQHTYSLLQVLPGAQPTLEGYAVGNVLASYVHLHWGGCPHLAAALVGKCCSSGRIHKSTVGSNPTAAAAAGIEGSSGSSSRGCVEKLQSSHCSFCQSKHVDSNASSSSSSIKIVSLLPSGTEIVYALGLQDRLVGVSGFCDWPAEARSKPWAVTSLIDVDSMSSDEIETAMQAFKASGESPFKVDMDLLRLHQPDLVLTQDACQTCDADRSLVCDALQQAGLNSNTTKVLVLHPKTLSEVLDSIISIGAAAGVARRAELLVSQLQARLNAVGAAVLLKCAAVAASTVAKSTVHHDAGSLKLAAGAKQQEAGCEAGSDQHAVGAAVQAKCAAVAASTVAKATVFKLLASSLKLAAGTKQQEAGCEAGSDQHAVGAAVQARCAAVAAPTTVAKANVRAGSLQLAAGAKQPEAGFETGSDTIQHATRDSTVDTEAVTCPAQNQQQQQNQQNQQHQQHQQQHGALRMEPQGVSRWQQAPRVLSLEGLHPLVLGGQWLPDVKLAAGAVDASGQMPGDAPRRITWDEVCGWAPDVLLLCPCSRSPAAAMPDVQRLVARPGFRDLTAVASGRVYLIDHSFFSRPGPRLVDGVELLYHLLWELPYGCVGPTQPYVAGEVADTYSSSSSSRAGHLLREVPHGRVGTDAASGAGPQSAVKGLVPDIDKLVGVDCSWRHDVLRIHYDVAMGAFQWVPL